MTSSKGEKMKQQRGAILNIDRAGQVVGFDVLATNENDEVLVLGCLRRLGCAPLVVDGQEEEKDSGGGQKQ